MPPIGRTSNFEYERPSDEGLPLETPRSRGCDCATTGVLVAAEVALACRLLALSRPVGAVVVTTDLGVDEGIPVVDACAVLELPVPAT